MLPFAVLCRLVPKISCCINICVKVTNSKSSTCDVFVVNLADGSFSLSILNILELVLK